MHNEFGLALPSVGSPVRDAALGDCDATVLMRAEGDWAVVCIIDHDRLGAASVTNCAEKIISHVCARHLRADESQKILPEHVLWMYRDTMGAWDLLVPSFAQHDPWRVEHVRFEPLGAGEREQFPYQVIHSWVENGTLALASDAALFLGMGVQVLSEP